MAAEPAEPERGEFAAVRLDMVGDRRRGDAAGFQAKSIQRLDMKMVRPAALRGAVPAMDVPRVRRRRQFTWCGGRFVQKIHLPPMTITTASRDSLRVQCRAFCCGSRHGLMPASRQAQPRCRFCVGEQNSSGRHCPPGIWEGHQRVEHRSELPPNLRSCRGDLEAFIFARLCAPLLQQIWSTIPSSSSLIVVISSRFTPPAAVGANRDGRI
jgi:hypothetical protein